MASRYVPDTNILSYVLQRRQVTIDRFAAAAKTDAEIFLCPVVYYEIRRGLLDKGVARQITDFDRLTADLIWVDVARPMWEDAANSWATHKRKGRPHQDADLLIAAFARVLQATVVTNDSDFRGLNVPVENWAA